MRWTKDIDDKILKLYHRGNSYSDISTAIGVSRGQVAGRIHRINKAGNRHTGGRIRASKETNSRLSAAADKVVPLRLTIGQLRHNTCRHIYGDPLVNAYYCGHKTLPDKPYCPAHNALNTRKGAPITIKEFDLDDSEGYD